jgi:hypothetical protein
MNTTIPENLNKKYALFSLHDCQFKNSKYARAEIKVIKWEACYLTDNLHSDFSFKNKCIKATKDAIIIFELRFYPTFLHFKINVGL